MGTKANPDIYDCYREAEPFEPLFTLLGRDPIAPYLVSIWAKIRLGKVREIDIDVNRLYVVAAQYQAAPDRDKGIAALNCASSMIYWRKKNRPDDLSE